MPIDLGAGRREHLQTIIGATLLAVCLAAILLLTIELKETGFERREYVIATDHSPPFQVVDADGQVSGAVVEMVNRAAARLNIKLRWKPVTSGPDNTFATDPEVDLWPFLMDLPERHSRYHIAEPFLTTTYLLVATSQTGTLADGGLTGKRIAFRDMLQFRRFFKEHFPQSVPVPTGNIDNMLRALCGGEVDAAITDMNHLNRFLMLSTNACLDFPLRAEGISTWKTELSLGSTFASAHVADLLRTQMGSLARKREFDDLFALYQPLASMSGTAMYTPTSVEKDKKTRFLVSAALACLAVLLSAWIFHLKRQSKKASELAEERFRHLTDMSHELRTPLNGIIGMATIMEEDPLSDAQRECLAIIQVSSNELLALINNVLDLTRSEFGGPAGREQELEIRSFVEGIIRIFNPKVHQKNLEVIISFAHDVPDVLMMDSPRLRQILLNLAGNAVKFTPTGTIHVTVSMVQFPTQDVHLRVEVKDTGPGMGEDEIEKLFRPFSQTLSGFHSAETGSGLGLEISRRLASLAGGFLGVTSELGMGSTFWFELPCRIPPAMHREGSRAWQSPDIRSHRCGTPSGRAVIVSASGDFSESARDHLERSGWAVHTAKSLGDLLPPSLPRLEPGTLVLIDFPLLAAAPREELAFFLHVARHPDAVTLTVCNGFADQQRLAELGIPWMRSVRKPFSLPEVLREYETAKANGYENAGAAATAIAVSAKAPGDGKPAGCRILVGEDNPVNQLVAKEMLARLGHKVTIAPDGETVIRIYRSTPDFDLVLLDCQMPVLDGFETARRLREMTVGKTLPIIACSASLRSNIKDRCLAAGMTEVLEKPLSKSVLQEVISRFASDGAGSDEAVSAGANVEAI